MNQASNKPDVDPGAPEGPRVVLLADDPSDTDEFDAKAHDSVAKAIAELVTSEPGGRVIGLEGSWGSGKSTVVRLVTSRLHQDRSRRKTAAQTRAVIFDAWAHQGDPLRRTFLETVINELLAVNWLSERYAKTVREKLTGKASKVRTRITSRLSLEGKLASAAAALVPLGLVLAQNHFSSHHHHRAAQVVGALMLIGPLLVVLGFSIAKIVGKIAGGSDANGWRRRLADLRPFGLFANEQETESRTEGIERGEPTSVEFEALFSDVLEASLTDSRRLLLVLDNLDRVEATEAKSILATMQTFTSSGSHRAKPWAPRVWTLIPYDPAGLDRLWNPLASGDEEPGVEGTDAPLTTPTAAAFVDKVFQVRFETPPLVLSDWRGYLARLLTEAIPQEEDVGALIRLRALYPGVAPNGLVATEGPTPRHLKQFVNQIGSIRRLRDDVPLVHVAYYVLLRHDRIDVARRLVEGDLPDPKLRYLFASGIEEDLAALHFGTEQPLAQQLLLGGSLEQALAAGDADAVGQLKERPGFVDALESLDLGSRVADGGIELTRAVAVLDAGGVAVTTPTVEAWSKGALLPLARTNPSWSLSGRESGVGLAILLDNLSSEDGTRLRELLTRIEARPGEADADGHLQLEGVAGLADTLIKRGASPEAVRVRVEIPTDRLSASLAFFGAHTSEEGSRAALEIGNPPIEVAQALVQAATSENFREVDPALSMLLPRPERVDFASLGTGCLDWLRGQDPDSGEQLDTLLIALDVVRRSVPFEDDLATAADDGTLMHLVSVASGNGWQGPAAMASMLHLHARPAFPEPQATRQAAQGSQIVRTALGDPTGSNELATAQLEWLEEHRDEAFDLLIQVSEGGGFQAWVDYQVEELGAASALIVSPSQYLAKWQDLQRALEEEVFTRVTADLLGETGSRTEIISGSSDPALAATALAVCAQMPDQDCVEDVRAWASSILNGTSAADWQDVLSRADGGPLLDIAVQLAGTDSAPSNPPGLADSLHAHFRALARGEEAWQPNADTFAKLTSLLSQAARGSTASELCAELEGFDGTVASGLFQTYGSFLAGERKFRTHGKLPNFIERAVAKNEWGSVEWIVSVAKKRKDMLKPTKERAEEIEHLRNGVEEKIKELNEAGLEAREELTELLGLLEP